MLNIIMVLMNKHRAVFASSTHDNFLCKRLKYIVKKCHYGLEMNDLFYAVKHTGMPELACGQHVGTVGHRLPGLLVAQVQHSPHLLFLKGCGNAHKIPSVSPSFSLIKALQELRAEE